MLLTDQPSLTEEPACILLVDDNPTNLQVLVETLNAQNFKLLIAKNGKNALRIAKNSKPELILLDIMMPDMDGYEVCKTLKSDPKTNSISIIFLSALNETKDKVKGLHLGAVDYISKPFQSEEIIARVYTQIKIHRLETALYAKNKQLETDKEHILENMSEGIIGFDKSGFISFANKASEIMLGILDNQLVNQHLFSDIFTTNKKTPVALLTSAKQAIDKKESFNDHNAVFYNKKGVSFPVDYSCSPIITNNELSGGILVFKNISEKNRRKKALKKALKELEQQQETLAHVSRLSTMGEMAAGFAHEVNQPLTAIANYAQVATRFIKNLEDSNISTVESIKDVMTKINTQARRAGEIITRIRSFVKKPNHVPKAIDPNKLLTDTVKLAEIDSKNNFINIHLNLDTDLPLIQADEVQIQQVLLNLIRNGLEAMKKSDHKEEGVRVAAELFEKKFIKISVTDRGYGLEKDAEEKLFTPFYTTKTEGMGIGLSICHSIIQSHRGSLTFKRHTESGTIFEFTVPIA